MTERRQGLPLVEAFPVEDQYVDGLGRMEVTGHNVRFVFYTGRPKDGGEYDREVATRLVMPMEAIMPLLKQIVTTAPMLGMIDARKLYEAFAGMAISGIGSTH
jgi:hypothetical protein